MSFTASFLFLILSVWFFLTLLTHVVAGGIRETMWQKLANRFNGRAISGGWLRRPQLIFRYGDTPVVVRPTRQHRMRHCTDIWFAWPESDWTLHIFTTQRPLPRSALRGLTALQNSRDVFYRYFEVLTNDVDRSRQILGESLRWEIQQLKQPPDIRDIEVRWQRDSLLVRKQISRNDLQGMEQFIRRALRIYDQSMLMRAEGIEFVGVEDSPLVDRVNCQICGEEILTEMVFCRQCQTPHHRECWEYFGRCAVFGCQESEYFVPRVAPRRAPDRRGTRRGSS